MVIIDKVDMIHRFVQAYNSAQDCIEENRMDEAKQRYRELMSMYKQISDSDMEAVHKDLAYDQVMKVYHGVKGMKVRSRINTKAVALAVVVIIISVVILIKPEIIGLVAFEINYPPVWNAADNEFTIRGVTDNGMFGAQERTVDMDAFFYDKNGHELTYLATSTEGLGVDIEDSFLTFIPAPGVFGTKTIMVVASDGENIVKQEIEVKIVK